MNKLMTFAPIALLLVAGCSVKELNDVATEGGIVSARFFAGLEQAADELDGTKTYFDAGLSIHWNAGDEVSVFTTTQNERFRFAGSTGDTSGELVKADESTASSTSLPVNYAVFPYSETTTISSAGEISLTFPSVQKYGGKTFGPGANTMVAATASKEDNSFNFKNVGGYLVIKLYGIGTIKKVSLSGNNGEKIAGNATVSIVNGSDPVTVMDASAGDTVTVECDEMIELSEAVSEFWFALPPVTFEKGFTVAITDKDDLIISKTTTSSKTITRNVKNSMVALKVDFEHGLCNDAIAEGNIVFADPKVKAICVTYWDTDGDGEISYAEAAAVKRLWVKDADPVYPFQSSNIDTFDELRFFGVDALNGAFSNSTLKSVRLPGSLVETQFGTFYGCTYLTNVDFSLADAFLSISQWAFAGCTSLTTIVFPKSVIQVGPNAFDDCTSLTSVTFLPETPPLLKADEELKTSMDDVPCIYVPAESVEAYKTAWAAYADRIKAIP